jgi:predicted ArsR family transcriptional regulator
MPEGKREILVELCRNPGASAADIGETLFLSPGAIRLHLRSLLADGLVEYVTYRGTVGRPKHNYRLTRLGRSLFPSASEQILIGVLDRLQATDEAVYQRVLAEIEGAFSNQAFRSDPVEATPVERRAEQLERIASEFGHECEAAVIDGNPEYRVYNCAIFEVARKNPAICQAERRWLQGFFPEARIELDTWMVEGDLFCRFAGGSRRAASAAEVAVTMVAEAPDDDLSATANPS